MRTIGLDLSMNSTGVCINTDNKYFEYYIIGSGATKAFKAACADEQFIHYREYDKSKSEKDDSYELKEQVKTSNLFNIIRKLNEVLDTYTDIDAAYIEGISYGSSSTNVLADLAGLNYLVRLSLANRNIPFTVVSPKANKKNAVGNGNADKEQMLSGWRIMDKSVCEFEKANAKIKLKIDDLADAFFLAYQR